MSGKETLEVGDEAETEAEAVESMTHLNVEELNLIKTRVEEALRVKGQKFIDGLRVGGLRCQSVVYDEGKCKVYCRVSCGAGQAGWMKNDVLRSVLVQRGYDYVVPIQSGQYIVATFYLPVDALNEVEVEGVAGKVAAEAAEVAGKTG